MVSLFEGVRFPWVPIGDFCVEGLGGLVGVKEKLETPLKGCDGGMCGLFTVGIQWTGKENGLGLVEFQLRRCPPSRYCPICSACS